MRVFVTGGTGAIGRHVVPELLRRGHDVTALARTPDKAAALREQGAEPVSVSLFDREGLTEAFAGHDAVVNLASSLPSMVRFLSRRAWEPNNRIRHEGSATVVDAALAAGVGRVVQESVSMLYRDGGAEWVDEDSPVDRYPAAVGNHAAEASARRFTEAGGTGVVLRFGWFLGPGAAHSEQLLALARRHVAASIGPPHTFVSSIHVADGATAVAAVLEAPAGTYNVVDDEPLTKREYADALARAAGATPWLRPPGRAALLLGDRLTSLTRSLRVSNARLRSATGWRPSHPSAREGLLATARTLWAG
ncbi:NAD-dependent epimerase/dehydratase family protein [Prauserella muralis]|uniref:Epimerase n=1 Tax=Prauserella muralis TaxID=588067 RepID=A0A2V4B6D9_9PSEU|nr:NAD(P)-dependent oxidoreductase [Prauserella muralis]PXY30898.1 epimerase [Prauserella muralis]TWE14854.1 nucleoside-diphosphate-sugar epimerase [Prauserella muralis]